jgi:hypothetical protein
MRSPDADPVGEADRQQLASIKELRAAGKPILDSDIDWLVGEVERLRGLIERWTEQGS